MGTVCSLRDKYMILPSDSLELNCVREDCHVEAVTGVLKMLSLQCWSLSCGFVRLHAV